VLGSIALGVLGSIAVSVNSIPVLLALYVLALGIGARANTKESGNQSRNRTGNHAHGRDDVLRRAPLNQCSGKCASDNCHRDHYHPKPVRRLTRKRLLPGVFDKRLGLCVGADHGFF